MDPLPSIDKVFSMVIQQKRQQPGTTITMEEHTAFISATEHQRCSSSSRGCGASPSGGGRGLPNKICTYCGRTSHTIDVCYCKHGYLSEHPLYPGRPQYQNRGSSSVSVNTATADRGHEIHEEDRKEEHPHGPDFQITLAQYQSLMALLQPPTNFARLGSIDNSKPSHINVSQVSQIGPTSLPGPSLRHPFILHTINYTSNNMHIQSLPFSNTDPWIIDSGATDHIISSLH